MFKDIADAMREGFGACLKEIKYLSERVEAVEKKVGITTKRKGTSSQNTTSPPKQTLEPGSESVNGTNAGRKSLAEDKALDKLRFLSVTETQSRFLKALKENEDLGAGNGGLGLAFTLLT
ncbi:hypothetical protein Bca52824_054622 [Brassica carinata]|uniref:Uncharacterized protein n=1 Tax=Brassica carinata TaxID=52824 RepID=A0A8X7R881_BRACI|nr:hypothetical protein Bca52824_054622 [Brassica carinata]